MIDKQMQQLPEFARTGKKGKKFGMEKFHSTLYVRNNLTRLQAVTLTGFAAKPNIGLASTSPILMLQEEKFKNAGLVSLPEISRLTMHNFTAAVSDANDSSGIWDRYVCMHVCMYVCMHVCMSV